MKEFNPNLLVEESDTIDILVNNLVKVKIWMNSVRQKMNDTKSEFIIFGNNTQTHKCIMREINTEEESVQRSCLVRYLSVWSDSDLTFKTHVKKKCAMAVMNLQRIKNIRKSKVIFSFCYYFIFIDGTNPIDLKKQKIFHFTDKLLLHNMAASSGLRENVYPINFFLKMFIFTILLLVVLY